MQCLWLTNVVYYGVLYKVILGEEQKRRNEKERQTYYGAKDYKTQEFIVQELKKWKCRKYYGIC